MFKNNLFVKVVLQVYLDQDQIQRFCQLANIQNHRKTLHLQGYMTMFDIAKPLNDATKMVGGDYEDAIRRDSLRPRKIRKLGDRRASW